MHGARVLARFARPALVGAACACLALSAGATPALAEPLNPVELMRLIHDLERGSQQLAQSTRNFLIRNGRWEPEGADRELWQRVRSFAEAGAELDRRYVREPYPGMEEDVRALLERARELHAQLGDPRPGGRPTPIWLTLQPGLRRLAGHYDWDYDGGRFHALAAEPTPLDAEIEELAGVWSADPYEGVGGGTAIVDRRPPELRDQPDWAPRFTLQDDLAVEVALTELGDLIRTLQVRVSSARARTDDAGVDDETAEEREPAEIRHAGFEIDLTALEGAVADAQGSFALHHSAADVASDAVVLVGLGRRVQLEVDRGQPSDAPAGAWASVRDELNRLAVIYDLERIPDD